MNALSPWPQTQVGWNTAISPHAPPTTPHYELQTQEYRLLDRHFFWGDAQRQMEDIRQEAMEAYQANNEIDPIPDSAYEETLSLLKQIPRSVPLPDIMWTEDGGIGLEWRPENGIVTMSLYGDNHVIYGAFFGDKREVEGICTLSDAALLQGFLTTLRNFYE